MDPPSPKSQPTDPMHHEMSTPTATPTPTGNGGPRRPGNLWTAAAREDMFRRREAGETWETICLDYPRRSRHAMQQQYSMMKKQKALANGTWTSNRRGRKRKNPTPDRWPGAVKRSGKWDTPEDEMTEDDEFAEMESEEAEDMEDGDSHGVSGYRDPSSAGARPSALTRSITDPVPRMPKGKMMTFNAEPIPPGTNGSSRPMITVESVSEEPELGGSFPPKRRKTSPDPARMSALPPPPSSSSLVAVAAAAQAVNAAQPTRYIPPEVAFSHEEINEFITRGIEKARQGARFYEAEDSTQKRAWEASVARANRRLQEAQEKIRWMNYDSGESIKAREMEYHEKLKQKAREFAEEKVVMRREFDREQKQREEVQTKNIESLARQNSDLRNQIELLQKQDNAITHRIEALVRKETAARPDLSSPATSDVNAAKAVAQSVLREHQIINYEKQRSEFIERVNRWPELQQKGQKALAFANSQFKSLSEAITKLNSEFEELSNKVLGKTVTSIQEKNEATDKTFDEVNNVLGSLQLEMEQFATDFVKSDSLITNGFNGDSNNAAGSNTDNPPAVASSLPPADNPPPAEDLLKSEEKPNVTSPNGAHSSATNPPPAVATSTPATNGPEPMVMG